MMLDIGGEVSPSFLFVFATMPLWIKNLNWTRDKNLRFFVKVFLVIIIVQILWANLYSFTENDPFRQLKGIMITISGLALFMYYYFVIRENPSVISWYVLGTFIASFIFIDMIALRDEEFIEEGALWKFQIFPRIVTGVVCVYLFFRKNYFINRFAPIAFVLVGMLGLATGSRNFGLTPFIAGGMIFVLNWAKTVNLSRIRQYALIGALLLYAGYAFLYVPGVMNGEITGGNTEQLKKADNPYNPFQLLALGRAESIVAFQAFLDKPLTGWGYYTPDPEWKYHYMLQQMHKDTRVQRTFISKKIPQHSVWGAYACNYGIIVFLAWGLVIYKLFRTFMWSLTCRDDGVLYRTLLTVTTLWDFLFNPMPTFKLTMGINMAILLVLSLQALREKGVRFKL